jgi:hypothetical protein
MPEVTRLSAGEGSPVRKAGGPCPVCPEINRFYVDPQHVTRLRTFHVDRTRKDMAWIHSVRNLCVYLGELGRDVPLRFAEAPAWWLSRKDLRSSVDAVHPNSSTVRHAEAWRYGCIHVAPAHCSR